MADDIAAPFPTAGPPVASRWPMTLRQVFLVVGLAAAVAAAIAVILWSQSPNYAPVQAGMSDKDAAEVVTALQGAGIPFRLDESGGGVMVPGDRLREVKLILAEAGLPRGAGPSMGDFSGQGFGQTPFMENALYVQALQTELARTIMELSPVQTARVHLAVPPRSAFVRNRQKPSASVMLDLFPGRMLDPGKVDAVAHLVASGIPELEAEQVTVIDERGNLLSRATSDSDSAITGSQFEYQRRYEESAARAIEDQLAPVVGASRVRATVHAELDFTRTYERQKTLDPNSRVAMRQDQEQESRRGELAGQGVPGALTNQPPETGTEIAEEQPASETVSSKNSSSTEFDIDETFREVTRPMGTVQRLSVAVLVDNKAMPDGGPGQPFSEQELQGLTDLAKQAVGFDEARGDTIAVLNSAFQAPPAMEAVEPPPIWEQPWVWDIARQVLGVVLVLLLALFVVKPIVNGLTKPEPPPMMMSGPGAGPGAVAGGGVIAPPMAAIPEGYDERMAAAQGLIGQDPRQVAQVMRNWVTDQNG